MGLGADVEGVLVDADVEGVLVDAALGVVDDEEAPPGKGIMWY